MPVKGTIVRGITEHRSECLCGSEQLYPQPPTEKQTSSEEPKWNQRDARAGSSQASLLVMTRFPPAHLRGAVLIHSRFPSRSPHSQPWHGSWPPARLQPTPSNPGCKAGYREKPEEWSTWSCSHLPGCPPCLHQLGQAPVTVPELVCPARHQKDFTRHRTRGQTLLQRAHTLLLETHS